MTLLELIFVGGILVLGAFAGIYGFSCGGALIGIVSFVITIASCVGGLHLAAILEQRLRSKSPLKCPCGLCGNDEFIWVGEDSNHDPIAKYKCGRLVILKNGLFEDVKQDAQAPAGKAG